MTVKNNLMNGRTVTVGKTLRNTTSNFSHIDYVKIQFVLLLVIGFKEMNNKVGYN